MCGRTHDEDAQMREVIATPRLDQDQAQHDRCDGDERRGDLDDIPGKNSDFNGNDDDQTTDTTHTDNGAPQDLETRL